MKKKLHKTILQFLLGKRYIPLDQKTLFKTLEILPQHHPVAEEILTDLVQEGVIEFKQRKICLTRKNEEIITGVLRTHPRGFGFVIPDESNDEVFIPKQFINQAMDGDHIEVVINPNSNWEKGPDGEIISIIARGRSHLAGTVYECTEKGSFVYAPVLGPDRFIRIRTPKKTVLKEGDRILMKIIEWPDKESGGVCEYVETIGHILDPKVDIEAAIHEFSIRHKFSSDCIDQATSFGKKVRKKDCAGREKLTKLSCFTIDPETAKDFDDALSISKDKKGHYHVGVHIADVAHYIKPGTPLDLEATKRCNSTYLPGSCIPMLPEELSNNLCSLRPKVDRLTMSVIMSFDEEGTLLTSRITRSVIHSRHRFSYEEAKEVLDGKKRSRYAKELQLMVDLCLLLKQKRHDRGSIDFALPEYVVQLTKDGVPTGMKKIEYDITHQLVEEFMLKANETVAKTLADRGKELLYRVHEEPADESMKDFFALARSLGFKLPKEPDIDDLQSLFDEAKKTSFGQQLSVGFIRSMKQAIYSKDNVGHYGLALEHYCHFTSPIRRYTDLIIQRLLFDEEDQERDLSRIALKSSEQERISFKAEMQVKTLKKLRLLQKWNAEDPDRTFDAFITKIKPFGITFEISDLMLSGFIHISKIGRDYFHFNPRNETLKGEKSGKLFKVGTPLTVVPTLIDLILLETQWEKLD